MKTVKVAAVIVVSFVCGVALAQEKKLNTDLKKVPITYELVKKSGFKVTLSKNGGQENIAGPQNGSACATTNESTARTHHKGVGVECSVGGQTATCTCDLDCEYVCKDKQGTETCDAKNCTVKLPGDTANGGAAQVMPSF